MFKIAGLDNLRRAISLQNLQGLLNFGCGISFSTGIFCSRGAHIISPLIISQSGLSFRSCSPNDT